MPSFISVLSCKLQIQHFSNNDMITSALSGSFFLQVAMQLYDNQANMARTTDQS